MNSSRARFYFTNSCRFAGDSGRVHEEDPICVLGRFVCLPRWIDSCGLFRSGCIVPHGRTFNTAEEGSRQRRRCTPEGSRCSPCSESRRPHSSSCCLLLTRLLRRTLEFCLQSQTSPTFVPSPFHGSWLNSKLPTE